MLLGARSSHLQAFLKRSSHAMQTLDFWRVNLRANASQGRCWIWETLSGLCEVSSSCSSLPWSFVRAFQGPVAFGGVAAEDGRQCARDFSWLHGRGFNLRVWLGGIGVDAKGIGQNQLARQSSVCAECPPYPRAIREESSRNGTRDGWSNRRLAPVQHLLCLWMEASSILMHFLCLLLALFFFQ